MKLSVQRRQFSVDIFDLFTGETLCVQDLLVEFDGFSCLVIDCVGFGEEEHGLLHLEVDHVAEELFLKQQSPLSCFDTFRDLTVFDLLFCKNLHDTGAFEGHLID